MPTEPQSKNFLGCIKLQTPGTKGSKQFFFPLENKETPDLYIQEIAEFIYGERLVQTSEEVQEVIIPLEGDITQAVREELHMLIDNPQELNFQQYQKDLKSGIYDNILELPESQRPFALYQDGEKIAVTESYDFLFQEVEGREKKGSNILVQQIGVERRLSMSRSTPEEMRFIFSKQVKQSGVATGEKVSLVERIEGGKELVN